CVTLTLRSFPTRRSSDLHGPQLALILQLLATDRHTIDQEFVRSALSDHASPLLRPNHTVVAAAVVLFILAFVAAGIARHSTLARSEEHTSELQSLRHLVC